MNDEHLIKMTFDLAKKGSGFVYPNPMVGAVLVKNNKIIATGFHKFFGVLHAEAEAIKIAGNKTKDATLYINLEPCNNWGKCPPCTDLIIKSKIKKVVCSMEDPNPKTCGQGLKKLRLNGIEVICGVLKKQATQLNKQYINHIKIVKPHITIKSAMSLDGKIATKTGDSKWITCQKSRNFVHHLRTQYDAIIVGTNTVIKDNPELSSHNKGKNPVRVIFDENLSTPKNYNILDGKIPTIIFHEHNLKKIPQYFIKDCIKLIPINFKLIKNDFNVVIDKLHDMSLKRILVEGGGQLNASVLSTGKVNDMLIFIAPILVGGKDAVTIVEGNGASLIRNSFKFKKIQIKKTDKDILIKGTF
ncbi:MAG: bifunctional diaminohydroxyphosphoribosylaminopyrimidine deaminase/5-amino-6-(5-phosphoribosylamino)uracil reductase RibD [Endomicrobiaceae bacterium]|nr:bifunctional diaminohydroxyphosphoribosylaminopyrimidine deaminase/5-amino-6-(5-phosphoribosylamino)uracil reductase RibD [Endomicrobiaceae bacterium]